MFKVDAKKFYSALAVFYLISSSVSAARILFYEVDSGGYSMLSGYKTFAEDLKKNHEIASIEKGGITKDKLSNYDILIIPNSKRQMTSEEISSIIWFVLQEGKAVFITNSEQSSNQLTIPFGTTMDSGTLIDVTDAMPGKDRYNFLISDFPDNPAAGTVRKGISRIGFYKGNGMEVSGNSKCIARTSSDTYSDTGSFPAGSRPCIASVALFGSGLVAILSSGDMLVNEQYQEYNNRQFAMNIVEWLSLTREPVYEENNTQLLHLTIKSMRLESMKLAQDLDRAKAERAEAVNQVNQISNELLNAQTELGQLKEGLIGPFTRTNWALIILGVCLLFGSIIYSQKKGSKTHVKDEDILEELGYELDQPKDGKKQEDEKLEQELNNL